ncbi:MAG: thiamine biosynthesis protein ThiF [Sulfurovum sp. 28-43-6]|nr:MAG: thiamine biosynthesis protein ThiF [Sulfurovum sp. 35-42-20]OYY54371.1 MAG: thiamine biosynthesis protein ThiF [Sulfurovum sp. 28-43-6]OYZ24151.1 MAG: thiamine biosynthesis protein ThiF [Sulfurovum sp. 16-42-52]OYZ47859.1 MAG: thiamine biosynthesis protein ThiF [Sulfurovum sp. 24-42-9]OZA43993.1 MAG: thiamine biosynthesis protein ThiF [Sulfurovum sp. 17-42-90]OZA61463.1 MAG: thiamine biosynthesis protein ThiF [Sulfurovum sp. 39-42-12]
MIVTQQEYFNRQIQLWGEATQKGLQDKKIVIVGAGGLGSTLAMALGTSGIGEIHLVDFDTVSGHNIHRQIAFTLQDEGKNKAKTVAALIESKNPFVKVQAFDMRFDAFAELDNQYDLILDATDNLATRAEIDKYAKQTNTPWIYASVEEFNGQVCFFDEANFEVFNISDHKPGGITAPIVMHIGSLQANLALRYLAGLPVAKDKLYYLYFNDEGELVTQKFGMPKA